MLCRVLNLLKDPNLLLELDLLLESDLPLEWSVLEDLNDDCLREGARLSWGAVLNLD